MKLSKRQILIYCGLIIVSLILLPISPLIIGSFIAFKVFKSASTKKKGAILATVIVLISLITTGVFASKFPTPTKPKVEPNTSTSQTASPRPTESSNPTPSPEPSSRIKAKVVKVVDGDTMDFSFDGKTERIRVIGINTPETVDPRKSVECFGQEASKQAKFYLETGMEVELEADPTQGERDKYQRLLRYVWTDNGTVDFGKVMISLGYAYEYTYNTPYKYQPIYKQAQKDAEAGKKGLWADGACVATPKPTTKPTTTTSTSTSGSTGTYTGSYSCSGPDLDCSDFSTHAQAQSFFNSCGFTATYDPMKLDSVGVGDGVACESLP